MVKTKTFATVLALLFAAGPAASHHNFAAHFRLEETVAISGVVTEFRFVNPHVRVYLDVMNEDGEVETWMAEGDASVALRRSGWTADQLKPGDRIQVIGSPARNGSNMLGWQNIVLADGSSIGGGDGRDAERQRILDESLARFRRERGR